MRLMPATVSPLLNKKHSCYICLLQECFYNGTVLLSRLKLSLEYMIKHDVYGCHIEPCMRKHSSCN